MTLIKQSAKINFAGGLETKTDPLQIPPGKFQALSNTVFSKGGLLQKRNGNQNIGSVPSPANYLTTFNENLTAVGTTIQAYSSAGKTFVNELPFYPCNIGTLPLIRSNTNQSQCDSATSANGLVCVAYTDQNPTSVSARLYAYSILDSVTGQMIITPQTIADADSIFGFPRVFVLGSYFVVVYTATNAGEKLKFVAQSYINISAAPVTGTISNSISPSVNVAFDGVVANNTLYLGWNGAAGAGLMMATLSANLAVSSAINPETHQFTQITMCADTINQVIYVIDYLTSSTTFYITAVNYALVNISGFPTSTTVSNGGLNVLGLASVAKNGSCLLFYGNLKFYSYDGSIPSAFTNSIEIFQSTAITPAKTIARSVCPASKAFSIVIDADTTQIYLLTSYQSPFQNTFFLLDGATGNVVARLAYQNGPSYLANGLPSVSLNGNVAQVAYLYKDLIQAVSKATNVPAGTQTTGIYSQTGINLASFTLASAAAIPSSNIGANLNLSGGFLWGYDGSIVSESNFFLYPDSVEVTTAAGGVGSISAQTYFYQFTYEWTDNQGNAFRSAPSIPVEVVVGADSSTNTINIPTLRLTYKTANPVKIVGYRWSTKQQEFYQFTSIQLPTLNSTTIDSETIIDTASDATILGNNLLYTNGGVVEDVGAPGFINTFIFDDRLWGIVGEDPNLMWYSKQVIEATPVEMSDLFTIYVAPSLGANGPTGPLTCGAPMDDKACLFKKSAIYYINGIGPDNTGANGQYSQPIFITSMVGCSNPNSIIFQPQGLMFEFASEAGNQIWLLGRDLQTQYIGAPVESFMQNATVLSVVAIPGTNQVRFNLSTGISLMYDYYYGQWGTFQNMPGISSTIYEGLHTFLNQYGQVFQENPGVYLDGSSPVLMSFTTGWYSLAELQGYQRAYYFLMLATYLSPHKIQIGVAYDYNPAIVQSPVIQPNNFTPPYGGSSPYGAGAYGGISQVEQWRVFFQQQRCQSFQISMTEIFDVLSGTAPGAGLSISGFNIVFGTKRGWAKISSAQSTG